MSRGLISGNYKILPLLLNFYHELTRILEVSDKSDPYFQVLYGSVILGLTRDGLKVGRAGVCVNVVHPLSVHTDESRRVLKVEMKRSGVF